MIGCMIPSTLTTEGISSDANVSARSRRRRKSRLHNLGIEKNGSRIDNSKYHTQETYKSRCAVHFSQQTG